MPRRPPAPPSHLTTLNDDDDARSGQLRVSINLSRTASFSMARNLTFFSIAVLAAVVSICHAAIAPEDYWKMMLPNTLMPNSIRERLQPDIIDEKTGTTVNVGKGGVNVNTGKGKPKGGTAVNVGKGGVHVATGKGKPQGGTTVGVGRKGVGVNTGHGNTHVNVSTGGVNVNTGHKGKPVVVSVKPGKSPFKYVYAASEDQLHDDPNVALFFLEKDLQPGTKLNLFFPKATESLKFLPRSEAKQCVTSLESMVDFARTRLGTPVKALATEVKKETVKQQYTIAPRVHKLASTKSVACHSENYVYAVYYCHETSDTSAYVVPLVGEDKTRVDAVAVCHKDTSQWNPKHVAFKVLKVKPGSVPICHFIPEDHIVKSGTLFDNILICDDPEYAKKFAEETWGKQKDAEKAAFDEVEKKKEAEEESEKSDIDQSDEDADAEEKEDHHVRHSLLYYMHEYVNETS
ncbi:hypothetical protein MRB53_004909 [Persea americana]|uniref:Uncharacterized protein n=1 Tax=Persea americana TaxID=3435 RepID=A0ACC2MCQ2_PERAE|nr:hypothetical protein MRB53_004909 [Persea americana]